MKKDMLPELCGKIEKEWQVAIDRMMAAAGAKGNEVDRLFFGWRCRQIRAAVLSLAAMDVEVCELALARDFAELAEAVGIGSGLIGRSDMNSVYLEILRFFYPAAEIGVEISVKINPEGADKPVGDGVTVNKRFSVFRERKEDVHEDQGNG